MSRVREVNRPNRPAIETKIEALIEALIEKLRALQGMSIPDADVFEIEEFISFLEELPERRCELQS